jgi:hypothetical protein
VFNIEKKAKHIEIEMEIKNIPYFLRAANADFLVNLPMETPNSWVIFFQNIGFPMVAPRKPNKNGLSSIFHVCK